MSASRRSPRQRSAQPEQPTTPAAHEVVEQPTTPADEQTATPETTTPETTTPETTTPETTTPENAPEVVEQPTADPADPEPAADQAPAPDRSRTADGRPACRVGRDVAPELPACWRPEVADDLGICGAHYSLRPDLRREAHRGQ